MTESIRTMIFVAAAACAALLAWLSRPVYYAPAATGATELFAPFEVSDANRLKVVQYDAEVGKLNTFEVARDRGRWVIPSHGNYPADAAEQLQRIAGLFVGLKAIVQQSDNSAEHERYGVKEPQADPSGDPKGYGRLVEIRDRSDTPLVQLIVGKAAATEEEGQPGERRDLYFVRRVGQDPVYVAEVPLDALTTNFEEWIERDLLKFGTSDVSRMELQDYSIIPTGPAQVSLVRRMDTEVVWNSGENQWELERMMVHQGPDSFETNLADDEELNKAKLDGVKSAVDELKIIDVDRKPQTLADALRDENFQLDRASTQELQQHGFFPVRDEEGRQQILGSNGGLTVTMNDGVQYALSFGNAKSAEKGDSTRLNRYLMVVAKIDDALLAPPMLEEVEPEPAGPASPAEAEEGAAEAEGAEPEADPEAEAAKQRRERIRRANQIKLDAHKDKLNQARARVDELNARFGEWFYVVSDDVYKRVQLGRADIVKDRQSARDEGYGVDAFRKLEQDGIEGKSTQPPRAPMLPEFGLPQ
jgi:hypothetical protein